MLVELRFIFALLAHLKRLASFKKGGTSYSMRFHNSEHYWFKEWCPFRFVSCFVRQSRNNNIARVFARSCFIETSVSPGAYVRSPKLSVVIINWNGKRFLHACLGSLMKQSRRDFEVILVDNGSIDGSVQFVAANFPQIEIISLQENLGFCKGNTIGISQAKGEYIALLNNDTEVDRHWLEELVKALEERPDVGFCASKMLLYDQRDLIDSGGDYYSIAGSGGKIGHRDRADKEGYNQQREVFGACAGAALYRRSMLEDIGLFDEDFFIAQEDVDISFRAQLKGYKCLYVPTALVYHRLNTTLKTYSPEYVYYGHRNSEYVYIKNVPFPLLIITLPLHLFDVFLSFCFFLAKGRGRPFLKAKWDVLRALPKLLKKRRVIQRARAVPISRIASLLEKNWLSLKIKRFTRLR